MSLSVDNALRKAQSHLKAGELIQAAKLYNQILSKFPKNQKAFKGYQKLKLLANSKAISKVEPPQAQVDELISLHHQQKFEEALLKVKVLIDLFPQAASLFNLQGASHAALYRYGAAIDSYRQALSIKPDYAQAYNNMGTALKNDYKIKEAISCYKKAIRNKSDYAEAYNNMGLALVKAGGLDAAIDSYNVALSIKPDYAHPYVNKGIALKSKGEFDAAIDSYIKAINVKPDYAEAYRNLSTFKTYRFEDKQIA